MKYNILYQKDSGDRTCFVCKANLYEYITTLKKDFYDFDIQRGIVKNSYLDTLYVTISRGDLIPPITLTAERYANITDELLSIEDNQTDILDGLQRTYRLWIYWRIHQIIQEQEISSYKDLIAYLKSNDEGQRIIDLYFVNVSFLKDFFIQDGEKALYDSFIESWSDYDLIFYIWFGLNDKEIVRKMLELNAGQKAVSSTHQYELLFLHFFDSEKVIIPEGMRLYREKSQDFIRIRRGHREVGEFQLASIIIAYQSFVQCKPLRITKVNDIKMKDDEDMSDKLEYYFRPENLNAFLRKVKEIDVSLCGRDPHNVGWFGKDTTLSGIYAAFGKYVCKDSLFYQSPEKLHDILRFIERNKIVFNISEFNVAYNNLSSVRVNVGDAVRTAIYRYTNELLSLRKSDWNTYFNLND